MSFRAEVLPEMGPEYAVCERALAAAGVRLPLPHRAGWGLARRGVDARRIVLRTPDGVCAAAFGVDAAASRALPGFRLLRVERFGAALPRPVWTAAVQALAALAHGGPRVLRLSVEVFSRDDETRAALGALLAQAGFARAAVRNWDTTLAIDLRPSERDLLASFSPFARRAIRSTEKLPVQVRVIDDPRLGARMEALRRETLGRTGAHYEALFDWPGVIELSQRLPDASRLVGLFRTDQVGAEALIGFDWGWWNGDSVSYFAGASSRPTDLSQVKVGHPLMWDLIAWAKRAGAAWFDLGGVPRGTAGSDDPVGGISQFKRFFSKQTAEVAADWVLEPRPLPARLATLVNTGVAWVARVAGGR